VTTCHTPIDQHRPVSDLPLHRGEDHGYRGHAASWNAIASGVSRAWQLATALVVALALILGAGIGGPASLAHAPALVTAAADVALLAAPSAEAPVLAVLPAGAEAQLTGAADGEFLEVSVAGQLGWAGAAGFGGGIDTAPVILDVTLRAEPAADGAILGAVPAGSTVILTGAAVDGFVAASFAGTGGWLPVTAIG
jgi:uncharacterized protein YraI